MRYSQKTQYTKKETCVIYLLGSPLAEDVFISHCRKDSLKSVFHSHVRGERYQTEVCVSQLKQRNMHPCLFVLEELNCTKVEAFRYVTVWTKIFLEAGYTVLNQGNILAYIKDLTDENLELYNSRKNADCKELMACEKCIMPTCNRQTCQFYTGEGRCPWEDSEERKKQVKTYVSEEEYHQIQKNAEACGQSVSGYIRESAVHMCVIPIDIDPVTKISEEIAEYRNAVTQLIFTIRKSGNYVPADLEYILEKTKQLILSHKKFLEVYTSHIERDEKEVGRTVKEIVNRHLKKERETHKE